MDIYDNSNIKLFYFNINLDAEIKSRNIQHAALFKSLKKDFAKGKEIINGILRISITSRKNRWRNI